MFREYRKYDGIGLAALLREGELEAADLVQAAAARMAEVNPTINAVVLDLSENAREAAADLPQGPLSGVPMVLKDLHASFSGVPMTSGCRFLADFVPDHDSEVVARIRRAGLLVVGKTNTPELGIMGVTEPALHGPTRNPWNPAHTPGGSSGGSGASVAAGIVPIGHGGDGGGSIRIPASCCGLFGIKPTRGRIPTGPDVGESWAGFDSDGFITRSVRDSAALLDLCHGQDLGAPYFAPPVESPFSQEVEREPGRLRIGFSNGSLFGENTHSECRRAVEQAAALCEELGHTVEEATLPFDREEMVRSYLTVVAASVALDITRAEQLTGRRATPRDFEPESWMLGLIGRATSSEEFLAASEARHLAGRAVAGAFGHLDIFLNATLAHPPQQVGEGALSRAERIQLRVLRTLPIRSLLHKALDELASSALEATANTMLFNMTGQPAMSVPLHTTPDGLPIGVQFAARFGEEATLLRLAGQIEKARPWFDRVPQL